MTLKVWCDPNRLKISVSLTSCGWKACQHPEYWFAPVTTSSDVRYTSTLQQGEDWNQGRSVKTNINPDILEFSHLLLHKPERLKYWPITKSVCFKWSGTYRLPLAHTFPVSELGLRFPTIFVTSQNCQSRQVTHRLARCESRQDLNLSLNPSSIFFIQLQVQRYDCLWGRTVRNRALFSPFVWYITSWDESKVF